MRGIEMPRFGLKETHLKRRNSFLRFFYCNMKNQLSLNFRPYQAEDKDRIIEIFVSNCPKYFDAQDKDDLIYFLENFTDENYLVALNGKQIIGCGGHYTKKEKEQHGIAWVMFESGSLGWRNLFKIADQFYQEIEKRIFAEGHLFDILINTTQLMERTFNRYGFETYQVIPDGFGKGLDEYKMRKSFKN